MDSKITHWLRNLEGHRRPACLCSVMSGPLLGRFKGTGGLLFEGSVVHVCGDLMLAAVWDLSWSCQLEQWSLHVVACASSQRGGCVPRNSISKAGYDLASEATHCHFPCGHRAVWIQREGTQKPLSQWEGCQSHITRACW